MPIALTCGVGVRAVACVMTETKRLVGILTNKKTLRIGMGDQWEIDETLVDGIGWRDWVEGLGGQIGWPLGESGIKRLMRPAQRICGRKSGGRKARGHEGNAFG